MGAMQGLSELVAGELVRLVDFVGVQRVADIGGSGGTLMSAVLDAHADIGGILFDLPEVAERASSAIEARNLGGRCHVLGGDFFASVPGGTDVYILKQILHDWNDEQCVTILSNIAKGLPSNGRVLILEMVIPDDRTPTAAQLMDLNMLAVLPGRERTRSEYATLFRDAGLQQRRSPRRTHRSRASKRLPLPRRARIAEAPHTGGHRPSLTMASHATVLPAGVSARDDVDVSVHADGPALLISGKAPGQGVSHRIEHLVPRVRNQLANRGGSEREMRRLGGRQPAAERERSPPVMDVEVAEASLPE